jgi:hypothetical protein
VRGGHLGLQLRHLRVCMHATTHTHREGTPASKLAVTLLCVCVCM